MFILDSNGIAVARHGLILQENGATRLGKVLEYLPGLRDTIFWPKNTKNLEILIFLYSQYIRYSQYTALGG